MFRVLEKLLLARQLKFEQGEINLLSGRVVLIPIQIFVATWRELKKASLDADAIMYEIGKQDGVYWIQLIKKYYNMKPRDMLEWGLHTMAMAGWGDTTPIKVDLGRRDSARFVTTNSPFAKFVGRTGRPVDALLAGFIGGGGSVIYDKSLECREIACISKGDARCEFVVSRAKTDWYGAYLKQSQMAQQPDAVAAGPNAAKSSKDR